MIINTSQHKLQNIVSCCKKAGMQFLKCAGMDKHILLDANPNSEAKKLSVLFKICICNH